MSESFKFTIGRYGEVVSVSSAQVGARRVSEGVYEISLSAPYPSDILCAVAVDDSNNGHIVVANYVSQSYSRIEGKFRVVTRGWWDDRPPQESDPVRGAEVHVMLESIGGDE